MSWKNNKPYIWLEKDPTSFDYILHLRANISGTHSLPTVPGYSPDDPDSASYTLNYNITNVGGGPPSVDFTISDYGFDPGAHEKLIVNINTNGGSPLGKSTAHATEADASGGGMDDMLRPFLDIFF